MNRPTKLVTLTTTAVLIAGLTATPAAANHTRAAGLTIKPVKVMTVVTPGNRTWDGVTPANRTWDGTRPRTA